MHQSVQHVLRFFTYDHLPQQLQEVSKPFADLAQQVAQRQPFNAETTVALRKLLEAKDAAVRATLPDAAKPKG
jgi:NAD(P)H-dependent FMN reductase